jgi:Tfp pilus assembly protein PilF
VRRGSSAVRRGHTPAGRGHTPAGRGHTPVRRGCPAAGPPGDPSPRGASRRRTGRPFLLLLLLLLAALSLSACGTDINSRELAEEYFNLGNAFFRLGDYESSFEYYTRAVELSDEVPAAGFNLARLHERRGDFDLALEVLDQLLLADPTNGLYRETRAYVLFRSGEEAAARAEYAVLLNEYPGRIRIRYNLGLLELDADNPDRAADVLEAGFPAADDDAEYRWVAAEAAYRTDDADRAAEHLEVFRALNVDEPEELARVAQRQYEWGFTLAALEILETIPETIAGDADLEFLQAAVYLDGTDDFEQGAASLEAAVRNGFDTESDAYVALLDGLREDERSVIEARIAGVLAELAAADS